jgi:hypothetical protein
MFDSIAPTLDARRYWPRAHRGGLRRLTHARHAYARTGTFDAWLHLIAARRRAHFREACLFAVTDWR